MNAHTPGPWHAVGQVVKGASGSANVAHVTQMMGDPPGTSARNAALIAAAPELLDALAEATGLLRGVVDAMGATYPKTCGTLTEHSERFLALLVKATK